VCLNELFEAKAFQKSARLGKDCFSHGLGFVRSLMTTNHNFTAQLVVLEISQRSLLILVLSNYLAI